MVFSNQSIKSSCNLALSQDSDRYEINFRKYDNKGLERLKAILKKWFEEKIDKLDYKQYKFGGL